MTSRKRPQNSALSSSVKSNKRNAKAASTSRSKRRRNLLETLEPRQLLAGPQLIGIQPNVGELIVEGSTVNTAPRVLTLRFDDGQSIDPTSLEAIKISRAGDDGTLGTDDDVVINPGLVSLGDNASNEVVVRFSERLQDDQYKVEIFGYDDPSKGIVGLQNSLGEFIQPRATGQRVDTTRFNLRLGALIESVVPQPVIRQADGSLTQNRNEIVVYFNEDPLFTENDENGQPTIRSAEHPRFYQLMLTQGTVRNTDDALYHPERVIYDSATHTARLIFADDLNQLASDADGNAGVSLYGGTFRLRIGTAVDDRVDLILPPIQTTVEASSTIDFGVPGLSIRFAEASAAGEAGSGRQISFTDSEDASGLSVSLVPAATGLDTIVFDLGSDPAGINPSSSIQDLIDFVSDPINGLSGEIVVAATNQNSADLSVTPIPARIINAPAITLVAAGDNLVDAFDVGVLGQGSELTSLVLQESIDPQTFVIQPYGANNDLGNDLTQSHVGLT